jgi:hypothetical protein
VDELVVDLLDELLPEELIPDVLLDDGPVLVTDELVVDVPVEEPDTLDDVPVPVTETGPVIEEESEVDAEPVSVAVLPVASKPSTKEWAYDKRRMITCSRRRPGAQCGPIRCRCLNISVATALLHASGHSVDERGVRTDTCRIIATTWRVRVKIRMRYNANGGRHARIASCLAACALDARYGTRRKSVLRLGERDVQGEDDWEGEGELEHV